MPEAPPCMRWRGLSWRVPACGQLPGERDPERRYSLSGFREQITGCPGLCFRQISPVVESVWTVNEFSLPGPGRRNRFRQPFQDSLAAESIDARCAA
jgi:hypothetical protein